MWGVYLWILGIELNWDHAKPYTLTLGTLTAALAAFDRFLWRWPPFKYFLSTPDLAGTWRVSLQSTYTDPETGKQAAPVDGFASIRQTHSSISIRLMTEQAESFLVSQNLDRHTDGTTFVYGLYQSDPIIHLRGQVSEIHYGSFKYKVIGSPADCLVGHYWTDRNTRGSIELKKVSNDNFDNYESAKIGVASK